MSHKDEPPRATCDPTQRTTMNRAATMLILAALPFLWCCAGEMDVLPKATPVAPIVPGPGAPRVTIAVDPPSPPRVVELREVVGWREQPRRRGSGGETIRSLVGRQVCVAPCGELVDGRQWQ